MNSLTHHRPTSTHPGAHAHSCAPLHTSKQTARPCTYTVRIAQRSLAHAHIRPLLQDEKKVWLKLCLFCPLPPVIHHKDVGRIVRNFFARTTTIERTGFARPFRSSQFRVFEWHSNREALGIKLDGKCDENPAFIR